MKIYKWAEIKEDFLDALLLGNGASIAIHSEFSYASLLATAAEEGYLKKNVQKVFNYLDTRDFELVLTVLWHTYHVNEALGVKEEESLEAYEDIRQALIDAVRKVHTDYDTAAKHFPHIYEFMSRFRTVISLNYDLIVYWSMLMGNQMYGLWFKDCFVDQQRFPEEWKWLREWHHTAKGATLVFYPHGNLVLATSLMEHEKKMIRDDDIGREDLLNQIVENWETGGVVPLFVSEGESDQKSRAIHRSEYLSRVYDEVLPELGSGIAIYGWSMSDSDDHILRRICQGNLERIAVSVHTRENSSLEIEEYCERVTRKFSRQKQKIEITFFDANSEGCWIY